MVRLARLGGAAAVMAWPALLWTGSAAAQEAERLMPSVRTIRPLAADPLAARLSVSLLSTDLLAKRGAERPPFELEWPADREVVAAVALGGVLPILLLGDGPDGHAVLVVDGRVFSRFRVEKESRDDMGQDWFIGGGVEATRRRWSGRALIMHRSSHLGDEFVVETGAQRIEFGSEHVDLFAAYEVPGLARVYGGSNLIFRSYLRRDTVLRQLALSDRVVVQLGADREWQPWPDDRLGITAGVDWQAAERTGWRRAVSASLGAGFRARASGRTLQLLLRFFDGPSPMGEFFLTPERWWALELQASF
jgi:hypothetical protein